MRKFIAVFFCCFQLMMMTAQDHLSLQRDSLIRNYLAGNTELLRPDSVGFFESRLLDADLSKYRIFFAGESHDHPGITELKWYLLNYFYRRANARVLLLEDPAAECWLLDQAMQKGNKNEYDRVAEYLSNKAEDRVFYERLYRFNKNLPSADRIRIFGTELETSPGFIETALDDLFYLPGIPESLLKSYERSKEDSVYHLRANLYRSVMHNTAPPGIAGETWIMLRVLLRQYTVAYRFWKDDMPTEEMYPREEIMYHNALDMFKLYHGATVFAQYGSFHICRSDSAEWYDVKPWTSVAAHLQNDSLSPVRGKVCSIDYLFTDQWYGRERLPDRRALVTTRQYRLGDFTLMKLDNSNHPFGTVPEKLNYAIIGDYDFIDARNYYRRYSRSDSTIRLFKRKSFGLSAGFLAGPESRMAIGLCYTRRKLGTQEMTLATGIEWEKKIAGNIQAVHVYGNFVNRQFLSAGAGFAYHLGHEKTAVTFRPEAGLAWRGLRLMYAPDIPLNTENTLIAEPVHFIRLRLFLPVYNLN